MKTCKHIFAFCLWLGSFPLISQTPVDVSSVTGKVICGYQGWFTCYGDGSPAASWRHWVNGVYQSDTPKPSPGNVTVEIYPDIDAYADLYQTGFGPFPDGTPAKLFSSYNTSTLDQHFAWMAQHGLDGVALQRFIQETYDGVFRVLRDSVAVRLKRAAEDHGRGFYLMYDVSGFNENNIEYLKNDWLTLNGTHNLTGSPAYFHHDGKPVICLWGLGFGHIDWEPAKSLEIINWFKSQGYYVIGGVPTWWRTGVGDSKPGFEAVYQAFDMLSPWTVGRYKNPAEVDNYKNSHLQPDLAYCNSYGIDYQPVAFPGSATSNWGVGPVNETPRLAGDFFWRQAYNARSLGIENLYVAMFDEFDEATAILPAADSYLRQPSDQYFLTYSTDGTYCSPDFYLRLTGEITDLFHGTAPNNPVFATPRSTAPVFLRTSFESGFDAMPGWNSSPDPSAGVAGASGTAPGGVPVCAPASGNAHHGTSAIHVAGNDQSATASYAYYRVFDVNIPVDAETWLWFRTFPENALGRHVTVDLVMTDGSTLRDSGAEDVNGVSMHPGQPRGTVGQWTQTACRIGQWLAGKTIDRVMVAYDYGPQTGAFEAWVDDLVIAHSNGSVNVWEPPVHAEPMVVFPNPAAAGSVVTATAPGASGNGAMRVWNMQGRLVQETAVRLDGPVAVETRGWPAGVYVMETQVEGKTWRTRLVVQ